MSDFATFDLECNTNTQASPTWTDLLGANREMRWADVDTQANIASASWPFMTRPAATGGVDYVYAFTADATGEGVISGAGTTPEAFNNASYNQFRWSWDNVGTFASAPIFTAYVSTAHAAITRSPDANNGGAANLFHGSTTDTGATARSYLKGNAFGRVDSAGAPAAAPLAVPAVTDGATGALTPTAGANWLANYQGLMGDTDWIAFPSTPAAVTADTWHAMLRLFTGPNMNPGTYTPVVSLKYTYT